jgi:hypothetical protein
VRSPSRYRTPSSDVCCRCRSLIIASMDILLPLNQNRLMCPRGTAVTVH